MQPRVGARIHAPARIDNRPPPKKPKTVILCRRDKHRVRHSERMQFAGGKFQSTRGMIALRAIVCFANADERCSSLRDSRNECNLPEANDDTGLRYSHGQHRPCGRFVPLRGTGRVDTRPYSSYSLFPSPQSLALSPTGWQTARRPGVRPPYGSCCRIPIALSERPLICLAALGTFPPRGEGSVGSPSPIA